MRFTGVLCTVVCVGAMTATGVLAQEVINRGTPRTPNDMSSPGHAAFQAQRDTGNANREYLDHAARTRPPAQRSQNAMQRAARGLLTEAVSPARSSRRTSMARSGPGTASMKSIAPQATAMC